MNLAKRSSRCTWPAAVVKICQQRRSFRLPLLTCCYSLLETLQSFDDLCLLGLNLLNLCRKCGKSAVQIALLRIRRRQQTEIGVEKVYCVHGVAFRLWLV